MKLKVPDLEQVVKFTTCRWVHFSIIQSNIFTKSCYIKQYDNDDDDYDDDMRLHTATINMIMSHY
jgi:hypothetical protein